MKSSFNFKNFLSKVLIFTFLFCLISATPAQTDNDYWKQRYQILEEKDGIATVLDRVNGTTFLWRIAPAKKLNTGENLDTLYADTTIYINLNQIDTTLFSDRFYVLGTAPIYNSGLATLVYDSDGNGFFSNLQ